MVEPQETTIVLSNFGRIEEIDSFAGSRYIRIQFSIHTNPQPT